MRITRYLCDIYKVENVPIYPEGRDDLTEQTEDSIDKTRDYYCQVQANSLQELADKLQEMSRRKK